MANEQLPISHVRFLQMRSREERLAALAELAAAKTYLPISLTEDLMTLDLTHDEKLAILAHTGSRDNLALEHFLTEQITQAPQEIAVAALHLWAQKTDNLLWFRMLQVVQSPLVSQRLFYTIVDLANHTGGERLLKAAAAAGGIEDMSTALHALILHRSAQWGVKSERLRDLAKATVQQGVNTPYPESKSMASALGYLAIFFPNDLNTLVAHHNYSEPWRDLIRVTLTSISHGAKSQGKQIKNAASKTLTDADKIVASWPAVWQRGDLPQAVITQMLTGLVQAHQARSAQDSSPFPWELFAGIADDLLLDAICKIEDHLLFARSLSCVIGLLMSPAPEALLTHLRERITASQDPGQLLAALPLRIRLDLTDETSGREGLSPFAAVKKEQRQTLAGSAQIDRVQFVDYGKESQAAGSNVTEEPTQLAQRKKFFKLAYGNQTVEPAKGDDYFSLLVDAWQIPNADKLDKVAAVARQVDGVLKICYINTLGRFRGQDSAVLKLMDFVRSSDRNYMSAVIHALGEIGTPRAAQELISSLTRPNVSSAQQLEICVELKKFDLANLQKELLSAFNDLGSGDLADQVLLEVRDMIASLLQTSAGNRSQTQVTNLAPSADISDTRLDQDLGGKIPNYRELSSEVKRALRTALFFHIQTTANNAPSSIDLSPVIDMQYKSLELLFRETFEEPCSRLMHTGVLQRRLDIIGYARPIPKAMDDFEHFIETLPVVREIPFFSNFKLRKMLRAICQFRPGKRFTLDGLKAFALFFLCFSRRECPYGLAEMFPLGFKSDTDIFQFCKSLHVFQDFRNRAAHEGFHPDAANDIEGIWRSTAEIVQTVFATKKIIEAPAAKTDDQNTRVRQPVIIEKKVS